jgi:hypothetical protein
MPFIDPTEIEKHPKMPYRSLATLLLAASFLTACGGARELYVDRPKTATETLKPLPGASNVDGDEFYVQFVSEFEYQGEADRQAGCSDFGGGYSKGGTTSLLLFQVSNETLRYRRETPALAFQSASGRCDISLEAKKVYLTPWMRLDSGKDTQIDYSFVASDSGGFDLGRIGADVNVASNVLALSGVGTGVALMGKVASGWMMSSAQQAPATAQAEPARQRRETRSLPPAVSLGAGGAGLGRTAFKVYEIAQSKLNPLPAEPELIGELKIQADVKSSLLLKTAANGLPDARDLSLDELWRAQIQTGNGLVGLEQFIDRAEHPARPNLQPDWSNYREVEIACRKLKVAMKDLGFDRYDRDAVLYYFLDKNPEWKNYNIAAPNALGDDLPYSQLQRYRERNFAGCLAADDYETMKSMGLPVNGAGDWNAMLGQAKEKDAYFAAIRSLERQLTAAIKTPNANEMERQLFPLIAAGPNGAGKALLQNHLGDFGLERILNTGIMPGEGLTVTAAQLAQILSSLKIADLSCAHPAFEQGRALPNVAILLFATAPDSPLAKGGALEFEFQGARISRLAIQSPSLRDFKQNVRSRPEIGDCRIEPSWLERL